MKKLADMQPNFDCAGITDVGRVRESNQDQYLIADLKKSMLVDATSLPLSQHPRLYGSSMGRLMLVADGMGGHASGERASTLAIDYMVDRLLNSVHWFFNLDRDPESDFLEDLKQLLRSAHEQIVREGLANDSDKGMGTTLTMAYIIWPRMYVVHAGDSRCYLFRRDKCERLTIDHTLARQLVDSGGLNEEEERTSRWSNVLWNVLGGNHRELTAEVRRVDLVPGDTVLLCSDGLHQYFDDDELMKIATSGECAQATCRDLICKANQRGGKDNITAILGRFGLDNEVSPGTTVEMEVPINKLIHKSQDETSGSDSDFPDFDTTPE